MDDIWDTLPETTSNMTKEQIANDPRRGKLVQAIGIDQTLNIHMATNRLRYGQVFLLCSDGLFKFCKESYIEKQLIKAKNEESMRDVAQELLREVFQNGAGDNVSAIIVKAE